MKPANLTVAIASGLIGMLGLFLASRAADDGIYLFGLLLFGFGILMNFLMIDRSFRHR